MSLFLLCLYVMIVMTVINGNQYVAGLSFVGLPTLALVGASLFVKKEKLLSWNSILVALLILFAFLSTNLNLSVSKFNNFINLAVSGFTFVIVSNARFSNDVFKRVITFYARFGLAICCILIFNYLFGIGIRVFNESNIRVSIQYFGITKDINYLSSFILPSFGVYFYKGLFTGKSKLLVAAGIIFVAIFLGGSRSCFLPMMFVCILMVWKFLKDRNKKNKGLIILLLVVAAVVITYVMVNSSIFSRTINFENYTDNARLRIWGFAMEGFYRSPFIGSGISSGTYYAQQHVRWVTHSCYVDMLTSQGIIGTLIIIAITSEMFKVNKKNKMFNVSMLMLFFIPLAFIDGYVCATFWMPMILCRILSKKARENDDILVVL